MSSFLDDWLTDDKGVFKSKNGKHKHLKYKNRPNTSLFNKKRKSLGNAPTTGNKGCKNFRSESAMAAHKTTVKNNYRPSSAFATHYTKSRTKSKKQPKQAQNKTTWQDNSMIQNKIKSLISSDCNRSKAKHPAIKTRNTRNYPGPWNTSFEIMFSELNKLKKSGNKVDLYAKHPTADISTDSFEISKIASTTLGNQTKSTNKITSRSKSNASNKHQR